MPDTEFAFVAELDLRLDAPQGRRRAGARLAFAALAALAINLAAVAIAWRETLVVPVTPQEQEIPVEIVQEAPPKPPPAPPPAPEPTPELKSQEYEKPATDAPRAGKSDHDDDTVAEKPKPVEAPPPPAETPSPTPEPAPSPAAAEPDTPKAAEAELPEPVKAEPTKTPAPALSKALADVLAKATEPPPDVEYGGEAVNSPITGGNAKATYFAKLYGLIVPKYHVPPISRAYGRILVGEIVFSVDGRGRLQQRYVGKGSGSMELDEAAMEAVGAASRSFPPPPDRKPLGIGFKYSSQ